ncbi:hypothetical protein DYB30_010432 [Aphanomyces astaci]|uniref:Diaminopimelate epimerase n=1 Tax=Aphanomyces astaci TaxID=112090 RepID=A0A397DA85_APHAT|nr:hypothetical protein DYB30_010432 [Aphanomyces astaci]
MLVPFTKFNGAGNDFVLIDNRSLGLHLTSAQAIRLCDRQLGIGADGLLLVVPCPSESADVAWEFWQCDGDTASFCGNGSRCFVRFVQSLLGHTNPVTFETGAGIVSGALVAATSNIAVLLPPPTALSLHATVHLASGPHVVHSVNTGVTKKLRLHVVTTVASPHGANANFVQVLGPNHLRVRTFERGVEGETLACGSGVAAAALVAAIVHGFTSPVKIDVRSGATLGIQFATPTSSQDQSFTNVLLIGPAEATFSGTVEL